MRPITPRVDPDAWIAPGAVVVGDVVLAPRASVWFGCVLRGDLAPIRIGESTNIQDLTLVHVDVDFPTEIGSRVTVGHRCIVHGCRVEDDALVGMGAVLLNGCRIGRGAVVAAGAVIRERFEVPDGMLAAGVPARIKGRVSEEVRERMAFGVSHYVEGMEKHRGGRYAPPPVRARGKETGK